MATKKKSKRNWKLAVKVERNTSKSKAGTAYTFRTKVEDEVIHIETPHGNRYVLRLDRYSKYDDLEISKVSNISTPLVLRCQSGNVIKIQGDE